MSLNDTPRANRLHIGIYGKRNAGKSSLINALTGQDIALVSPEAGTTTDPVFKSMELHPVGPVVFIDTAGFDDAGELGALRVKRTGEVLDKTDIAIVVIDGAALKNVQTAEKQQADSSHTDAGCVRDALSDEKRWVDALTAKEVPVIIAVNKLDAFIEKTTLEDVDGSTMKAALEGGDGPKPENTAITGSGGHRGTAAGSLLGEITQALGDHSIVAVSALNRSGLDQLRKAIGAAVPEDFLREKILDDLVEEGGLALLVMPQDIQAPKGRLILPQVQTLRELLDQRCTAVATTADGLERALTVLNRAPDLIITDSQCFDEVYRKKPAESALTSFSVLFAAYKGDIDQFVAGVSPLDDMTEKSRVLIAEACTHVPLSEDIGRVKIPRLLRKKFGEGLEIVNVCGNDFPVQDELKKFDLIIHCGSCMFNRKHVMNRIAAAEAAGVPITNYGVVLAKLAGILEKITLP